MATNSSLTIDTHFGLQETFDEDHAPFLLQTLQGNEGISVPYAYDCTLFRSRSLPEVAPAELINTQAAVSIRLKDDQFLRRRGQIAALNRSGVSDERRQQQTDFYVYTCRIVPAFKMLDNEVTFRVFEKMDLRAIFAEVLNSFPGVPAFAGSGYVNFSFLSKDDTPEMEYCVQFAESSFNFLSRLMAQHGIFYIYDHRQTSQLAENETMVLGRSIAFLQQCGDDPRMTIDPFRADNNKVTAFAVSSTPVQRHVWVADFNEDSPVQPPIEPKGEGDRDIDPGFDLIDEREGGDSSVPSRSRFLMEQFPNNGDSLTLMRSLEAGVFVAQGQTKNRSFLAGRLFQAISDPTDPQRSGTQYAITMLSFTAVENSYGHNTANDVFNFFWNTIGQMSWMPFADNDGAQIPDIVSNLASQGLSSYIQNEGAYAVGHVLYPNTSGGASKPYFPNFAFGGVAGAGTAALSTVVGNIKKIIDRHRDSYGNAFLAVPFTRNNTPLPLPVARQPAVGGPHLAVVIGRKGVDQEDRGKLFLNDEGKVRVRFGWQRTVPLKNAKDNPQLTTDPLATDFRAAWVRVGAGWGGRRHGHEFLPRIGDEVLIGFIDGDPSRPVIIGSLYNGFAPPPFDPTQYRSGIRTQTEPKGSSDAERFHLLRFDDRQEQEQLLLRSQGRMDVTALNSSYQTTYGNLNILVDKATDKDASPEGGAALIKTATGFNLTVGGDRSEDVGGDQNLTVKGKVQADLKSDVTAVVKGAYKINAAEIVLEASEKLTLKVGSSYVVLDGSSVSISAPFVYVNSGGSPGQTDDATMKDAAAPELADPGDPPDWLSKRKSDPKPASQGGAPHIAQTQHATPAAVSPDGGHIIVGTIPENEQVIR